MAVSDSEMENFEENLEENYEENFEEDDDDLYEQDDSTQQLELLKQKQSELCNELTNLKSQATIEIKDKQNFLETYQFCFRDQENLVRKIRHRIEMGHKVESEYQKPEERNLLFQMALGKSNLESHPHTWLIKNIINKFPDLLYDKDYRHNLATLLHFAVNEANTSFIKAILRIRLETKIFKYLLGEADSEGKNCIHAAVSKEDFDPSLTLELLKKASEVEINLAAADEKGMTPLHLAVDYTKSTKHGLEIAKYLMQYGDKAFDEDLKAKQNRVSVFRWHHQSKEKFKKNRVQRQRPASGNIASSTNHKPEGKKEGKETTDKAKEKEEQRKQESKEAKKGNSFKLLLESPVNSRRNSTSKPGPGSDTKDTDLYYKANVTRQLHKHTPEISKSQSQRKPFDQPASKTAKPKSTRIQNSRPSDKIADEVAKEIKLHYFRSIFNEGTKRTTKSAVKFLFNENPKNNQICFQFPPLKEKESVNIDFEEFKESYDGFVFDEVLQYFYLGMVKTGETRGPKNFSGTGRADALKFFEWLKSKKVTNIIKVVVEDMQSGLPVHSDEAIEKALKSFEIEILDWRKYDLDPRTIREGCGKSKLREIHLHWSGNNAILRSWSEEDGLVKLEHLRHIFVHAAKNMVDSQERMQNNWEQFKIRIQERKKDCQVELCEPDNSNGRNSTNRGTSQASSNSQGQNQIDSNRWLKIMDEFAGEIHELTGWRDYLKDTKTEPPSELHKDVRVALIDDGANFMDKRIREKLEIGRNFDSGNRDPGLNGSSDPFHGSTTGHGTIMAHMIGRVCPPVKIVACKLDISSGPDGKNSFTAKSAAEAVNFAVGGGFDIISISWTIQRSPGNQAEIKELENALKLAIDKKILIFCSAPDIGGGSQEKLADYYPFGYFSKSDGIFKIGAAEANGRKWAWSGDSENIDFLLPGVDVRLPEGDRIDPSDWIPNTGSSVATALAVGLAALVIHCVRLGAIFNEKQKSNASFNVNADTLKNIKKADFMKKAFKNITQRKIEKNKRLDVDGFFDGDTARSVHKDNTEDEMERWEAVTLLAGKLVL
ncbi:hypothetical protein BOTCAL_0641g00020 [Botryotinia calthae]|uniref:Peptidase S8/S53 domain-containing protein n=1 Tax=Botryotinia calthae TaxID=38488 RepID=A0A4Y8CI34_9HELO|nr:hypothetical protein BOTCAL_0641g00020 [Botryotinia calthae]